MEFGRAFALGFVKAAGEKPGYFGVRPSTGKAMGQFMDENLPLTDRLKSYEAFQRARAGEEPMSHLKALGTLSAVAAPVAGVIGAIQGAVAAKQENDVLDALRRWETGLISPPKSVPKAALKGGLAAAVVFGLGGMAFGEWLRSMQASDISKAKKMVEAGPKEIEMQFLKDLIEEHAPLED